MPTAASPATFNTSCQIALRLETTRDCVMSGPKVGSWVGMVAGLGWWGPGLVNNNNTSRRWSRLARPKNLIAAASDLPEQQEDGHGT